ncbi:hypothetical protein [Bacillus sp. FJAT-27445]|uniref:hypothetical protein n=1 Tax=Bacillus sp. FJAT-27445 TaxID=1679166 RepID=UPI000743CFE3|nr:hypothetical protein [Bacillus sp. FJAT-27445]
MVYEKVQPHCMVCAKPFKRNDLVYTDTMFTQIQHAGCFCYKQEFIKDKGTYEDIVGKYPEYLEKFIVSDQPVANILVVNSLRRNR